MGFRGDPEILERLDRVASAMGEQLGGLDISRSAVLKLIVTTTLPLLELEHLREIPGVTQGEALNGLMDYIAKLNKMVPRVAGSKKDESQDADDWQDEAKEAG